MSAANAANGFVTRAAARARRKYRSLLKVPYERPLRPPVSWLYRGDRVTCPICEGTFRKFMPKVKPVGPSRRNAKCPRCGASERHRHLWLYLRNRTNLFTESLRVLHFAPEWIIQKKLRRCPNLDYISADLDPHSAMVKMDITDITYPDDSFEVVLCSHVLEHVADDRKAMSELYRVLKPGGWAICWCRSTTSVKERSKTPPWSHRKAASVCSGKRIMFGSTAATSRKDSKRPALQ